MTQTKKEFQFASSVKDRKPLSITIEIGVASSFLDDEIATELEQIQKEARLDGFRAGKAPIDLIKDKFLEQAKNRAVENVIRRTVFDALRKENFAPVDAPIIDEFDYEIGKDMKYSFSAECHPVVEVKGYKNIPIQKEIFKVTDASLAESLEALGKSNAKIVPVDVNTAADEESLVSIDFDAFDEAGNKVQEVTTKNQLIDLSSQSTIKEFRDVLKGSKAGDLKETKITYPSAYQNKLIAGKTILFKVKVNEVKVRQNPKLDDEFAKDMGLSNLDELKSKIKEAVEQEEKRRQDITVEKEIIGFLLKNNVFDVPQSLVSNKEAQLIERMRDYFQKQGEPKEYADQEIEKSKESINKEANNDVRLAYILSFICDKEHIDVTDEELEEDKKKMKASNPSRDKEVDEYFAKNRENIKASLKETKLLQFLVGNASIKEVIKDMPLKKEKK